MALVTAVEQVQSLAWELLHATGVPPPKQNPVQYELNHVQEMKPQRRLEDNMAKFYSWLLLGNGSSVIVFDSLYFSVFFIFYTGSLYHCNKEKT